MWDERIFEGHTPRTWFITEQYKSRRAMNCDVGLWIIEQVALRKFILGASRTVSRTVDEHLGKLQAGKHNNPHLQTIYNMDSDLKIYECATANLATAKMLVKTLRESTYPQYLILN